jgi:hypothetical protein
MPAGLNLFGRIWRLTDAEDDSVGGAVPTGTVIYDSVFARVSSTKPTQALLDQGLETVEIFTGVLSPAGMLLQHNDQLEILSPNSSRHYDKRFVIIGLQPSSMEDDRRFMVVTMRRLEKAHSNLLQ